MQLSAHHVSELLEKPSGKLKATIYIPTNPASSPENLTADRIRFKNALQVINNHHAFDERELGAVIDKLYDELYENLEFWKHQELGLAILFSSDGYEYFTLPFEVIEQEYITDHFVISPLLLIASADTTYYLLDVNFTKPRLLYGVRGKFHDVSAGIMPASFDDEVGREEYQKQLQHQSGGGARFHGHSEEGALNEDERRYLKKVAAAADEQLRGLEKPLLLAGTTNRTGVIKKYLDYDHVLDTTVVGNYETASLDELYQKAHLITTDRLRSARDAAAAHVANTAPQFIAIGKTEIEEAAESGRIETLYVPAYRVTNDSARPTNESDVVVDLPSNIEEIEPMVTKVLQQGGTIVAVEIDRHDIFDVPKAICRY